MGGVSAVFVGHGVLPERLADAAGLAARLGVPVERGVPDAGFSDAALVLDADGLWLTGSGMRLRGDLARLLPRLKPGRLGGELLVKAARVKGVESPCAVDATAGLGEDACLLAAAGFSVDLYERDPVVAALLRDSLLRAAADPELAETVSRMRLHEQDGVAGLRSLPTPPDVVLLDPMFPERAKSASVKKKAQLLQMLESPCDDEEALLDAAIAAKPRKVVIKRPVKGPCLAGVKPSYSVAGKAVRYDCVALPR